MGSPLTSAYLADDPGRVIAGDERAQQPEGKQPPHAVLVSEGRLCGDYMRASGHAATDKPVIELPGTDQRMEVFRAQRFELSIRSHGQAATIAAHESSSYQPTACPSLRKSEPPR